MASADCVANVFNTSICWSLKGSGALRPTPMSPDRHVVANHRHLHVAPDTPGAEPAREHRGRCRLRLDVGDVHDPPLENGACHRAPGHEGAGEELTVDLDGVGDRRSPHDEVQQLPVEPEHRRERGPRQPAHAVDDCLEHWLGIRQRSRHGAEDLGRGGLLLERLTGRTSGRRQLGFESGHLREPRVPRGLSHRATSRFR